MTSRNFPQQKESERERERGRQGGSTRTAIRVVQKRYKQPFSFASCHYSRIFHTAKPKRASVGGREREREGEWGGNETFVAFVTPAAKIVSNKTFSFILSLTLFLSWSSSKFVPVYMLFIGRPSTGHAHLDMQSLPTKTCDRKKEGVLHRNMVQFRSIFYIAQESKGLL